MKATRRTATCGIVAAVALGGWSSASPQPNAGTVIVHATYQAGPTSPQGIEQAMPSADVRMSGPGGVSVVTRTDTFGNARFRLSAGRYVAHLVSADGCTAGTYDATVTVRPIKPSVRESPAEIRRSNRISAAHLTA